VNVEDVVSHGRLRWYGHVKRKDKTDWVSAFRELQVQGTKSKWRGRTTWNECVKVDMKWLGFIKDDAHERDKVRSLTSGNRPTLPP